MIKAGFPMACIYYSNPGRAAGDKVGVSANTEAVSHSENIFAFWRINLSNMQSNVFHYQALQPLHFKRTSPVR